MSRVARTLGLMRSLGIDYGNPLRALRLAGLYAPFLGSGSLGFDLGAHVDRWVRGRMSKPSTGYDCGVEVRTGWEGHAMQCPKCGTENSEGASMCERCGIVFEKYFKYHPRPGEAGPPTLSLPVAGQRRSTASAPGNGLRALLLPPEPKADWAAVAARAAVFLVLLVWGIRLMSSTIAENTVGQSFLHLVNLPFHEAGHVFFRPFGAFMQSLGGTLGQLLMPAICLGVLLIQTRDPFGASVALWWLGENFLDIAPYIDDARAGELPLLGGNFGHSAPYGFHDWEYLLTESGLLGLDHTLARVSFALGCLIMLAALAWGALLLHSQYQAAARSMPA